MLLQQFIFVIFTFDFISIDLFRRMNTIQIIRRIYEMLYRNSPITFGIVYKTIQDWYTNAM